jgi:hypothetical protein
MEMPTWNVFNVLTLLDNFPLVDKHVISLNWLGFELAQSPNQ